MLQKQSAHLNLTGGLQKKDDEFLVIPSKLAAADNVQFDDASTVIRRGGQSSLSFGGGSVGRLRRGFTHNGVALLSHDSGLHRMWKTGGSAQVVNPTTVDGFTSPQVFPRAGMLTSRIGGVDPKGTAYGSGVPLFDGSFDCASVGNVTCHAYETRDTNGTGRQTIRVVMIDDATGFRIYDSIIRDSTKILVKPRVVASATNFFIYFGSFASGGTSFNIKVLKVTATGTASAISSSLVSGTTGGTTEGTTSDPILFDVAFTADLTRLGLVTLSNNSALELDYRDLNTTDGATVLDSNQLVPTVRPRTLTALYTKNGTSYVLHGFYGINTNVAKGASYQFAPTSTTSSAETTVGTAAVASTVGRIAAYENSSTQIYLAYDSTVAVSTAFKSTLRMSRFTHAYASLTECAGFTPWFVGGRIVSINSRLYLPMVFVSTNYQGTTYLVDLTSALLNLGVSGTPGAPPHVVARIDYGEGALTYDRWKLSTRVPSAPARSNSVVLPYLKYETNLRIAGTSNETPWALAQAVIEFDSQLQHEEINGVTLLAGACPHLFDGGQYVEEGFHHGPEVVGSNTPAGSGDYQFANATAVYTVAFTWAWQDAQGNWHESAPSNETTASITSGSGNYYITPGLISPPTQKPNARLLMYRTKGSSTDPTLYLAVKTDGTSITSDTDLDDGEQIYTSGNVLPNTPAPACRHISTFQKRLVLSGCGDGSRVHWSKVTTPGFGVEFSSGDPTHQTAVPSDKGRVAGTEEMDDFLVVLCENGIGIIGGSGPNDSGTQGQYSDFSSKVTETGCSWDSPKSIIRGPEGVWFRSPFGIRLFSRGGGLGMVGDKQVGSEVDSLVSGTIVAIAGDAKQQVRFYQSSGTVLVWDYQWHQWTRFTGVANIDAVYADDRYYHLSNYNTSTPLLRYTDETVTTDTDDAGASAQAFLGYIETPWLSFAGIQGFQRVYRLRVLGKNTTSSVNVNFIVRSYLDFNATTVVESTTSLIPVTAAGDIQFEHHFATQKCESLKLGIFFYPATTGRLRITDLTLLCGVKAGYFKTPSSQRY